MDPLVRLTCDELLDHPWFDGFREWFHPELEVSILGREIEQEMQD